MRYLFIIVFSCCIASCSPTIQPADIDKIEAHLEALSLGKGDLTKLTVIYDDLHGLHGGLTLQIDGTGKVQQQAVSKKGVSEKAGTPKDSIANKVLMELVKLLIEQEAWEQRTPDRQPVPDESRARLTITYGEDSVTIWEWYNDMKENQRLIKIKEFMKSIAWQAQ